MQSESVQSQSNPAPASRRGLVLDRVFLLGRTLSEYLLFFGLSEEFLRGKRVLDIAGGVSSFSAEAAALGADTTALDPIYALTPDEIEQRSRADIEHVVRGVENLPVYKWDYYKNPDNMRKLRSRALDGFLADYRKTRGTRYREGKLPSLPFQDCEFDLVLTSYFLFVYEDQFDYEFHRASLLEIMRVTKGEARIYPTVTLEAERSQFLNSALNDSALSQFAFEIVPTDFEFLIGSNNFLRVTRRSSVPDKTNPTANERE